MGGGGCTENATVSVAAWLCLELWTQNSSALMLSFAQLNKCFTHQSPCAGSLARVVGTVRNQAKTLLVGEGRRSHQCDCARSPPGSWWRNKELTHAQD